VVRWYSSTCSSDPHHGFLLTHITTSHRILFVCAASSLLCVATRIPRYSSSNWLAVSSINPHSSTIAILCYHEGLCLCTFSEPFSDISRRLLTHLLAPISFTFTCHVLPAPLLSKMAFQCTVPRTETCDALVRLEPGGGGCVCGDGSCVMDVARSTVHPGEIETVVHRHSVHGATIVA
jgi:hypothetical protein